MLGNFVHYVRQLPSGEFSQGWGFIKALSINPDNRPVVLIYDKEQPEQSNTFNVDLCAVDASPEFIEKYKAMSDEVKQLADKVNADLARQVQEADAKIQEMKNKILGEPVEFTHKPGYIADDENKAA